MRISIISNDKDFVELTEAYQNINWINAKSIKEIANTVPLQTVMYGCEEKPE